MSYAIFRTQKIKATVLDKCQRHNQRENKNYSNNEIDLNKKHLNYELHNKRNIDYQEEINLKISSRYKVKKSVRKDAVLNVECLMTSDKEFFNTIGPEETKRYFKEAYEFIKNKFGEDNVLYATVHMDETTPHMHAGFVPITKDGRLSAKDYLDGKQRLRNLQNDFYDYISSKGFNLDRGLSSDETHSKNIKIKDLKKKEIKELKNEFNNLTNEVDFLNKERDERVKDLSRINKILSENSMDMYEINNIDFQEVEEGLISRRKTGQVKVNKKDFDKLRDSALKAYTQHSLYSNFERDIKNLETYNNGLSEENEELRRKLNQERKEHSEKIYKVEKKHEWDKDLLRRLFNFVKSNDLMDKLNDFEKSQKEKMLCNKTKEHELER